MKENYIFPFFWLHGEDEEKLREYMNVINDANCSAVCIESRPHPDFCGDRWWHDLNMRSGRVSIVYCSCRYPMTF